MAAFVAYAYAMSVIAFDVAAFDAEGATVIQGAVSGYIEVIAGVGSEATLGVITLQALDGVALTRSRVCAVQDDEVNLPGNLRSLRGRTQPGQQFRP